MSIILDVGPAIDAHRRALAALFDVAPERVEVRESVTWEGTTPVVSLDIRLDGERAPAKWWEVTQSILDLAKARADLAAAKRRAEERIASLPWWKRWLLRAWTAALVTRHHPAGVILALAIAIAVLLALAGGAAR